MQKKFFTDCVDIVGSACKQYDGEKNYISTGAVDVDYIVPSEVEQFDYINRPSRANLEVNKGDILFAKMQGTKKTLLINELLAQNIYSTGFCAVRPKDGILIERCLYYLVSSETFLLQKDKNCSGATQKAITNAGLGKIMIKVPEYDSQEMLADELDKLAKIIERRKSQLEKMDELIKARFVEMFGDVRENPNKYDIVPFIDIVQYMGDIGSNGANKVVVDHLDMKDEEDYAMMVRFTNFTKNDFTDDVKYVSKEAYDFFKKSQIFGGELIICKIGSAGQNYVMPYLNRPVSLGLNQIMVRIKENILMSYLYQYLHTDYGEFLISGCINGAVTKTITKTKLKKIPVILPPMELQKEFESFVQQVDKSKVAVQKALNEAQLLFDSLMQECYG